MEKKVFDNLTEFWFDARIFAGIMGIYRDDKVYS